MAEAVTMLHSWLKAPGRMSELPFGCAHSFSETRGHSFSQTLEKQVEQSRTALQNCSSCAVPEQRCWMCLCAFADGGLCGWFRSSWPGRLPIRSRLIWKCCNRGCSLHAQWNGHRNCKCVFLIPTDQPFSSKQSSFTQTVYSANIQLVAYLFYHISGFTLLAQSLQCCMCQIRSNLFSNPYPLVAECRHYSLVLHHLLHTFNHFAPVDYYKESSCNYALLCSQGVNLAKVMEAGDFICCALQRKTNSKVAQAKSKTLSWFRKGRDFNIWYLTPLSLLHASWCVALMQTAFKSE